jgi:hypothetical protein
VKKANTVKADICVGYSNEKWDGLNRRLQQADEIAWAEAVDVFERRMRERFFRCIDALFASDTRPDMRQDGKDTANACVPGFAIVALCCLLIETLQGFREPLHLEIEREVSCNFPNGPCAKNPLGTNRRFVNFLRRASFGAAFEGKRAQKFTSGIRNGILHEAETRKWVIWRDEPVGEIVAAEEDGFALNRTLFYEAIKNEFNGYIEELRNPANTDLRNRFVAKMHQLSAKT